MLTFFSFSFGCRVNEAERETLDKQMLKEGFLYNKNNPSIFIINTCAVTHKAEREARNLIYQIKRKNPKTKIVITGCAATYWQKNKLYQSLPIDLLVDNLNKEFLVKILKKRLKKELKEKSYPSLSACKTLLTNIRQKNKFLSSGRLLVKIQDGCQRFCTFCIVPYLRGLPKSKKINGIVEEINGQKDKISEVILTAINTEAFGYDSGEDFVDLIKKVLEKTSIPRLSFGSIHPWSITNQFINFYQKILTANRLVNFFHIPVQSGSNTILKLMKRGYKTEEIMEKLQALNKINPLSYLSTDVIVGFLEETDSEFEKTYQFLERSPLVRFHIFRFSKRKNTAAFYMAKNLNEPNEEEKKKRAQALTKLAAKKYQAFLEKNLNRPSTALILNKKQEDYFEALLDNQLSVLIKEEKKIKPGKIINVKVEKIKKGRLLGKKI